MEPIELEPRYSLGKMPGHCLKCLAKQKYEVCLRRLLRDEDSAEIRADSKMAALGGS
jgi:hypothetical protein